MVNKKHLREINEKLYELRSKKSLHNSTCNECGSSFHKTKNMTDICSDHCLEISRNKKLNERWANKEEKPRKPACLVSRRFEYTQVNTGRPAWMKRFDSCRG